MAVVVGGMRARLIRESVYHCIHDSLADLGWFNAGRRHKAITFPGVTETNENEIPINRIALSDEDLSESDLEMGSTAVETRWTFWLDFYAQDDSLGKEVVHDVRDILGGRMSSIGRSSANIPVYDYRLATPVVIFHVAVEEIVVDRAHEFPKPYQKHWYACRFTVLDAYDDDILP